MSDSISNFLTVIRNASLAQKDSCVGRYSKVNLAIAEILKNEGFVRNAAEETTSEGHRCVRVQLKYVDGEPAIRGLDRVSTSGCRVYTSYDAIPKVLGGLGISILTTPKGVLKDKDARKQKQGGEIICTVW